MSRNYENAVHGRRKTSIVNESNATLQEDNRLAQELQKIEKEKAKLSRRNSEVMYQKVPQRRPSLAETRMQRTLSKHDIYLPLEKRRSSIVEEPTSQGGAATGPAINRRNSRSMSTTSAPPYADLIDKDRFEKFCCDTRKLSQTTLGQVKHELKISEDDETGFMGDMNLYLRISNGATKKSEGEAKLEAGEEEGNIKWDNFIHPRSRNSLTGIGVD